MIVNYNTSSCSRLPSLEGLFEQVSMSIARISGMIRVDIGEHLDENIRITRTRREVKVARGGATLGGRDRS